MARREVIEVRCDRCSRVETQNKDELPDYVGKSEEKGKYEFSIKFRDKRVTYGDLCRRCRRTLSNHYQKIIMADEDEKPPNAKKT